jgi:2-polyprenyl-3-methyl-5-hydroxy-6-metoxy-1,4-benzoquinol methylase
MAASATATSYFSNVRPEVAALLPPRATNVLEIGCGEGRFSAQVKSRKTYWGVEPSAAAAEKARGVLDRVVVGTYEQAEPELPDAHFDLVICNDVIEHMVDHDAFLDAIQRKMAPGGSIVGSVPNVRYLPHLAKLLFGREWRYEDEGILDRTHLRFFTISSLRRAFMEHGFEVEKLVGLNSVIAESPLPGRLRWAGYLGLLQLLTLRDQTDSQFLQFGFVVRPRGSRS